MLGQPTKQRVYVLKAVDAVDDVPVTTRVAARLVAQHPNQKDRDITETLYSVTDVKCMIIKDVHISLGVANGSRGVVGGNELRVDDVDWSPDININASLSIIS